MGSLCRKFVGSPYFDYFYNYQIKLPPPPPSLIKTRNHHQVTVTVTATPFNIRFRYPIIIYNKNRFRLNSVTDDSISVSAAYQLLEVTPDCTLSHLKAAFRSKVKQFHPDVRKSNDDSSDSMIRRVIQAYEVLSNLSKLEIIETECLDPFDAPECEAFDIFVNEVLCVGKGCPYSCVKTAPHAFTFSSSTGTAHATSQGHGEDYQVQLAVGQCPRSCIHYVTPSQRVILEELLGSILNMPFDCSAEAELLYSLVVKAKFENNRYREPKKQPKASTKHVDFY